jgi:hypothetical protein
MVYRPAPARNSSVAPNAHKSREEGRTMEQWSRLGGTELIEFGKEIVAMRLERIGCRVRRPANPRDGRLEVTAADGRPLEVFVSTQRVGGYAFWSKRRLQPARHRFAALVLLSDEPEPGVYLVPSVDWLEPAPPLTDRDYVGQKSPPEYGIEIGRSRLASLRRYAWTEQAAGAHFG